MNIERRVFPVEGIEFREANGNLTFRGYAAVFNQLSEPIGGAFREKISPGAFARTIKNGDVKMLINHDPNLLLARSKAGVGTLRLSEDSTGLQVEAEMANTSYARDLGAVMERGDLDQMSFGFSKVQDVWDRSDPKMPVRDLKENRLFDVSPVTFPAYPQTTASVRNEARGILLAAGINAPALDLSDIDLDLALAFLTSGEERVGKSISAANAAKIQAAIEALEAMMGMDDEPMQKNAMPMKAGDPCPTCGKTMTADSKGNVSCPVHGTAPMKQMNSLTLEIEARQRRLKLLEHLIAA